MNTHTATERFVFIIKYSKKLKKKILQKVWLKYDKRESYKAKRYRVQQTSIRKDKCYYKVIAICYYGKKNLDNQNQIQRLQSSTNACQNLYHLSKNSNDIWYHTEYNYSGSSRCIYAIDFFFYLP